MGFALFSGGRNNKSQMDMKVIKAELVALAGHEQALRSLLDELFGQVRQEAGTLLYTLHQDLEEPRRFFFYEQYSDDAALQEHMESPILQRVLSLAAAHLESQCIQTYGMDRSSWMADKPATVAYGQAERPAGSRWVRHDLKGRQNAYCMCHACAKFRPQEEGKGCAIIAEVLAAAARLNVVLPVWECPAFDPRAEAKTQKPGLPY